MDLGPSVSALAQRDESVMAEPFPYRKLPGQRRGFIRGASVWLGADHLLLVRSSRFQEEYKRYQLRDIQAIVVANAPRFHISTRSAAIAALLLIAYTSTRATELRTGIPFATIVGTLAATLVLAWLVISAAFSCRCRIYTAVSSDDLPSLYRMWTAHIFLGQVEPLIQQAQGSLDASWVQAIAGRTIGPSEALTAMPAAATPVPASRAAPPIFAFGALIAALFAVALWNTFTFQSPPLWTETVNTILALAEAIAAIAVIVQHYRAQHDQVRKDRSQASSMQKLAVATLAVMGVSYYLRSVLIGFMTGTRAAITKLGVRMILPASFDPYVHEASAILAAALGLVGLIILMTRPTPPEGPRVIYPST
jgi:hypothetical protein